MDDMNSALEILSDKADPFTGTGPGHSAQDESMLRKSQKIMDRNAATARQSQWKPLYHISPPSGWMNDPNGLIQFNGKYHVFYQLHPSAPEWGPMHWGHMTSTDLAHWTSEPIALAPDQPYETGCFSGCAVNDNGTLTLVYTAHNEHSDVKEVQCIAWYIPETGCFEKYTGNPVIPCFPEDGSADFRDPKVWYGDRKWNMIVGTSKHEKGRALLYTSDDLIHWNYRDVMCESDGTQGTIWECPNYCRVDGKDVVIVCPVGMKGHKNIYFIGNFDTGTGRFTQELCRELDFGPSFYAAQVFNDEKGRTLFMAWMDTWDAEYPSARDGWAGALTIPRELHIRDGILCQTPVPELELLRDTRLINGAFILTENTNPLENISLCCAEVTFTVQLSGSDGDFEFSVCGDSPEGVGLSLLYDCRTDSFRISSENSRKNRNDNPAVKRHLRKNTVTVHAYIDRSSLEIFIDEGELVFSHRFYPTEPSLRYSLKGKSLTVSSVQVWKLQNAFFN